MSEKIKVIKAKICGCGRIHFIDNDKIQRALNADMNLLFICGHCGTATIIGADREPDWFDSKKEIFNMYSYNIKRDTIIDVSQFENGKDKKGYAEIIYSIGKPVMMLTGMNATDFNHRTGMFFDRWHPDFSQIKRRNITVEEIMKFIEKYEHDRSTVNMNALLRTLTDEEADALSHLVIKGLDWSDTKYAH